MDLTRHKKPRNERVGRCVLTTQNYESIWMSAPTPIFRSCCQLAVCIFQCIARHITFCSWSAEGWVCSVDEGLSEWKRKTESIMVMIQLGCEYQTSSAARALVRTSLRKFIHLTDVSRWYVALVPVMCMGSNIWVNKLWRRKFEIWVHLYLLSLRPSAGFPLQN
jgi:hypothetical protein